MTVSVRTRWKSLAGGAIVTSAVTAQTAQDCTWQSYRLPTNVLPTAYRITLQTVLEDQSNVTGRVEIDLDVAQPSTCVVMHAVGMTISDIFAVSREGSEQQGELMDSSQ